MFCLQLGVQCLIDEDSFSYVTIELTRVYLQLLPSLQIVQFIHMSSFSATEIPGAAFIHGGLYGKGCLSMLKPQIYAAGGLAIALLVLDVLALMFAGCLIAANKDGYIGIA